MGDMSLFNSSHRFHLHMHNSGNLLNWLNPSNFVILEQSKFLVIFNCGSQCKIEHNPILPTIIQNKAKQKTMKLLKNMWKENVLFPQFSRFVSQHCYNSCEKTSIFFGLDRAIIWLHLTIEKVCSEYDWHTEQKVPVRWNNFIASMERKHLLLCKDFFLHNFHLRYSFGMFLCE